MGEGPGIEFIARLLLVDASIEIVSHAADAARGELLGRLDDAGIRDAYTSSQAAVTTAEANAKLAARELERANRLESAGAVATRDVETAELQRTSAEAQAANARAQFAAAEKNLARTVIRSPFTGIVSERPVNLVGRADSRGTPEYNMALSDRRSQAVKEYLQRLGIQPARLIPVPRGELDASGADEGGWAKDRRVDSEWQ